MSFKTSIPTQHEIANLPTYDIAMENWDPQRYYDGMNDDLSIVSSQDSQNSGEHDQHIVNSSAVTNATMLSEYDQDDISIELQPEILEYIDYNPINSSYLSYNSREQLFNSFFTKIDLDAIVDLPHNVDPLDEEAEDKTTKFYEAKYYFENLNYWDDKDHDNWNHALSSGGADYRYQ